MDSAARWYTHPMDVAIKSRNKYNPRDPQRALALFNSHTGRRNMEMTEGTYSRMNRYITSQSDIPIFLQALKDGCLGFFLGFTWGIVMDVALDPQKWSSDRHDQLRPSTRFGPKIGNRQFLMPRTPHNIGMFTKMPLLRGKQFFRFMFWWTFFTGLWSWVRDTDDIWNSVLAGPLMFFFLKRRVLANSPLRSKWLLRRAYAGARFMATFEAVIMMMDRGVTRLSPVFEAPSVATYLYGGPPMVTGDPNESFIENEKDIGKDDDDEESPEDMDEDDEGMFKLPKVLHVGEEFMP